MSVDMVVCSLILNLALGRDDGSALVALSLGKEPLVPIG